MSESSPDSEPHPRSSTPGAARWRSTKPAPAATYAGPLGEPLNYPTLLTALRPPPSDRVPELDAEAAYSSALAIAGCPQQSDGPTIYLAVADTPRSRDTLVYMLRWENVRRAPSGPPLPAGRDPRPDRVGPCIVLVDATTGVSHGAMHLGRDGV